MSRSVARVCWSLLAIFVLAEGQPAVATQLLLRDGRVLQGRRGETAGLAMDAEPGKDDSNDARIVFIDDDLRRTFVPRFQVKAVEMSQPGEIIERYRLPQRIMTNGPAVKSVGPALRLQPFDEFGRRIYTMNTAKRQVDVIQGISELTPTWTKVEGITHIWDMRLATNSIPRDTLARILARQTDPKDIEQRKKVARFYLQAERYEEAGAELEGILREFPDPAVKEQLGPSLQAIKRLSATRLLQELTLRREAGQYKLVLAALERFPVDDISGENVQRLREMIDEYEAYQKRRAEALGQMDELMGQVKDEANRKRLEPIRREIGEELNITTLPRLASFRQMVGDPSLLAEEKLALAISGWILGGESATMKLPVALSAYQVRGLVRKYLNTPDKLGRSAMLESFHSEEAATPANVAKIIASMRPPVQTVLAGTNVAAVPGPAAPPAEPAPAAQPGEAAFLPEAAQPAAPPGRDNALTANEPAAPAAPAGTVPGYFELEVPGQGNAPPVRYLVQLPPEYDPLRRYPAVVTLRGAGANAEFEIDWWAGPWDGSSRRGQATRHGYIVIAPDWLAGHQKEYNYSAEEHAAVLDCLRDACKRFSVDTDRVFLAGHSIGGDAAWDIGLAHPDLWAGLIPIAARSDKYAAFYRDHAQYVPVYWVCGELDGGQMVSNARDLNECMGRLNNFTLVEYLGRGHESFSDEILRIFDWMGRLKRDFFPKKFSCKTMRPWDNFFYWVEVADLPPRSVVFPADWPPGRGVRPAIVEGDIKANNGVFVNAAAGRVTVWLSPEMVNFDERVTVTVESKRINLRGSSAAGDLETMLEDVRTRGDRQHPFWLKIETPTGKVLGR